MHLRVIVGPGHVSRRDDYSASIGYPVEHVVANCYLSPVDMWMSLHPVQDFDKGHRDEASKCDDNQNALTGRNGLWLERLDQRHGRGKGANRSHNSHDHVHPTSPTEG